MAQKRIPPLRNPQVLAPLCLALLIAGCIDPGQSRLMRAYRAMQDLPPDLQALQGRTIVLDPGHGGKESGAVGPKGLREKDVNLAVAKSLAGMLTDAGAQVILTRATDREVVATDSLRADLAERANIANRAKADLFLSIHHNATLDPKNTLDETQTYYKMEDQGPSLDAARAIHAALSRNLDLPKNALFPGNYAVLRSCDSAAVLGEASYLSHPYFEKLLTQSEKTALEAKAYFYGIAQYFAQGLPTATMSLVGDKLPKLTVLFSEAVQRDSIRLLLDGQAIPFSLENETLQYEPKVRLPNGRHRIQLQARSVRGNSTPLIKTTYEVAEKPARVMVNSAFPVPPLEGPMPIIAKVLDADGLPVADGTQVTWKTNTGVFLRDSTVTKEGSAINYMVDVERFPVNVTVLAGKAQGTLSFQDKQEAVVLGQVMDPEENPIPGAKIAIGETLTVSNEDGYFWVYPFPAKARDMVVEAPGYKRHVRPLRDPEYQGVVLEPLFNQPFAQKTLMLYPMGGWQTFKTAEYLKQYLEKAGASAVIARTPEEPRDDQSCVRTTNRLGADLFVGIGEGTQAVAEHYPTSVTGKRVGDRLAQLLTGQVRPSSSYPLIHTACPGINVLLPATNNLAELQARAYRILVALSPEHPKAASLKTVVKTEDGRLVSGAILLLDSDWGGQSTPQGEWTFENLPPGTHRITVSEGPLTKTLWVTLSEHEQKAIEVIIDHKEPPRDLG